MTKDPNILLSFINTKLRDQYLSLSTLCEDLELDIDEVNQVLNSIGYFYDNNLNKFISN